VEEGRCEEASAQAHALKGALLNLGLEEPAQRAADLERELKRSFTPENTAQARQLMQELSVVIQNFSAEGED
jgi:HPt (histidine-containing phosphotransfer) domain-containing protein